MDLSARPLRIREAPILDSTVVPDKIPLVILRKYIKRQIESRGYQHSDELPAGLGRDISDCPLPTANGANSSNSFLYAE
jgi:hypothetical protein